MTQRGAVEVGGASASGSAILAFDTPVPVGGRAPGGIRREIAVAEDGAIAIFTSGDLVAVDVRDHLATAAANTAGLPSEVMVIAGQSGGTVRAIATDATGGVAIQDSGADITVSGSTDAPFQQGAGVVSVDTIRITQSTDDAAAVALADDSIALEAGTATVGSVQVLGLAADGTRPAIRTSTTGAVAVQDDAGSLTVDAPLATPVNVRIGDTVDAVLVTAAGELNVLATAQPGVDIGDVTVNNAAGAAAVNVQDGGNVLSVDDAAGSLTIDNAALSVTGGGVEATALRVTVATDSTGVLSVDDNAGSLTVDNAALSVVGGGVEATALRVTLANDSTGVVSVDDNAGSLTVDAPLATPVAVRIGDTVDAANVTAAGELNVLSSAQPGVDIGDVTLTAGTATVGSFTIVGRDGSGASRAIGITTERAAYTAWQDIYLDENAIQRSVTFTSSQISETPGNASALVAAVAGSRIRLVAFKISADAGVGSVRWFSGSVGGTAISSSSFLAAESGWTNGENGAWRRSYQTNVGEGLFLGGNANAPLGVDVWTVTVP